LILIDLSVRARGCGGDLIHSSRPDELPPQISAHGLDLVKKEILQEIKKLLAGANRVL
jgi:hypothetical protein